MKKFKLVIGLILTTAIGTVLAYNATLPNRLELQQADYNAAFTRLEELAPLYKKAKQDELEEFCLLTRMEIAEDVTITDSYRYSKECNNIKASKLKPDYNSKGEQHPDLYIGQGNNTRERAKSYVKLNCTKEVYDVFDEVYDYAEKKGIKGEVPFVIATADSQCANNLTTPNNPGNVNNNDRGNRVGFFTMAEGMNAITDTLTNKYIGGLSKIGHLSQGGRYKIDTKFDCANAPAPYKCYASSPENWNNNVLRALTAIHGEADEHFNIKIK